MEVINNTNNSNHQAWGHHRYSSLSLASAANSEDNFSVAESYHTCLESGGGEDHQLPEISGSILLTGRVASLSCLADVKEEDSMDMSFASQPALQQQMMKSPQPLTVARLALSSEFGVLRRLSMDHNDHDHNPVTDSPVRWVKTTTPRHPKELELDCILPMLLTVESKSRRAFSSNTSTTAMKLEDMTDDVQLQILSFVPLEDVRVLMATNRRYRKLLFTRNAQNLWKNWCSTHFNNSILQDDKKIVVDDLSLPTAARPSSLLSNDLSHWHQQANMSLLLSMAQSQPTDIDVKQLNEYHSHQQVPSSRSRRRRSRPRVHTTDGSHQPLLKYEFLQDMEQWMVQFTGRVGQGDRCVRSNKPFPRPTLIDSAQWMISPSQMGQHGKLSSSSSGKNPHHAILDMFCRSARAVSPPRPAWRPFVAPFYSPSDSTAVHLTPRFVSYFEVSISEGPASNSNASSTDCVAVGVATESFDWHTRMPGWDASSFGYHGDDGGIFHSSGGMLRKFGPAYGRGDVVGCGIDHVMRGIFFTLNGEFLGYAWSGLPQEVLERDMYPVVGIDTNDLIHCNFGNEPFTYDLKSLIVKHEELVHQSLSLTQKMSNSIRSV